MFKKLKHKFNNFWYKYHRKKMYKYLSKTIGAKRYLKADKKELDAIKAAFNSGETHASYDFNSAYPSWMVHGKYPLVNQEDDEVQKRFNEHYFPKN